MGRLIAALLLLAAGCDDLACAEAEARGRHRVRRGAVVSVAGEVVDSGPADAGFVDAGSCPPDCGLLTDEYAAQFESDGYFIATHQVIPNLTDLARVSFVAVYRQPGVSGTEEMYSEYDPTPKSGFFYNHSTERHLAGAPGSNSSPTQRANTADAGAIPSNPLIECMAFDMTQASNASKISWYRYEDGGTKPLGKYSVGTTMGGSIRDAGAGIAFSVGARASGDGGVPFSGILSELIVVDGTLSEAECAEFVHYSADAGQRMAHPMGHSRWASFAHWWRFGDGAGDNWYDGGPIVEDQIGANDLRVIINGVERVVWTN